MTDGTEEGDNGGTEAAAEETPADGDAEDPAETGAAESTDPGGPDDLIAQIATVDETAAAEVESLRSRIDELEAELADRTDTAEELESKLKRARADFQNYKKRAKEREEELRERATEDLVERLLDVRDNLVRALSQDDDVEVRDGVEATLSTFDRILDAEEVSAIDPDVGDEVDPATHEVVHRTESDLPEGAIAEVYRPGYEMAESVLRPAQVTVSDGADTGADEEDPQASDAESED